MPNYGSTWTTIGGQQQHTGPNPEQTLLKDIMAGQDPTLAAQQLGITGIQNQLGLVGPELQSTLAYNQAMSGYQGQNLQLSEQGLGLQQQANQAQQAQAAAQQGFEQQQYGIQQGQYPQQYAEAALAYQNALFNTRSNQAISGTTLTEGGKRDISTLGQQYGFQQADIARAQALSQVGQAAEVSGYGYQQGQLKNAAQQLALNAAANGISQQQLLTMLNYGQQQAGVGAAQDVISLFGQLGQAEIGQMATAGPAISLAGQAAGVNAIAGTQLGLGGRIRP